MNASFTQGDSDNNPVPNVDSPRAISNVCTQWCEEANTAIRTDPTPLRIPFSFFGCLNEFTISS